jgi:hypothetical protein
VIVARKNKKDLSPEHFEAIWMYCDFILDYFGDDKGAPDHLYSRQAFERWFERYNREQVINGRRRGDWNPVSPLYEE